MKKTIPTVTGKISTTEMGFTLAHEHIFAHDEGVISNFPRIWDRAQAIKLARRKLTEAYDAGIRTIMDMSVLGNGRDIFAVREAAAGLPIHILAATGAFYPNQLPGFFHTQSIQVLSDCFVHDITEGISGTDTKAAVIKVCTDAPGLTPDVEKALRAAARASLETGTPIHTHARAENESGLWQMDIFREEGVPSQRVYIGHVMDSGNIDYAKRLLDQGVYIGFDRFASAPVDSVKIQSALSILARLCARGYAKQILLGNDGCSYQTVARAEPPRMAPSLDGNDYLVLPNAILPRLSALGITPARIRLLTEENPRRLLEGHCM